MSLRVRRLNSTNSPNSPNSPNSLTHQTLKLLILLLAAFLRLYHLPELPPGLNFDEAGSGVLALDILDGSPKIWWRIGGGQEPFWPYLAALSTVILGNVPLALRLPAVCLSLLTIAVIYPLMTSLFRPRQGQTLALLTMLGVSLSGWHLHFSRLGFRAILLPFFATLALYFFWRSCASKPSRLRENSPLTFTSYFPFRVPTSSSTILASFFTALAIYSYLAARLLPFVILLFLLLYWFRASGRRLSVFSLISNFSFLIPLFLLPLIIYFIFNPADFMARAATVSLFNPQWNQGDLLGAAWRTLVLTLSTFLGLAGDPNPLVNLPGQPALSNFLVPFFILGLLISLYQATRSLLPPNPSSLTTPQPSNLPTFQPPAPYSPHLLLLCWWSLMLLPAILAPEGAPHHLRLLGTLVPTYAFVSLGMITVINFLFHFITTPLLSSLFSLLPATCYLLLALQTYTNYFIRWPTSTDFTLPFDLYALRLAHDIAQAPAEVVYVLPMDIRAADEARHYTIDYLLTPPTPYSLIRSFPQFAVAPYSAYVYIPVDERNAETLLNKATVGKKELRLVRWTADKHREADAKEIITYLLETTATPLGRQSFPAYDIETYSLTPPTPQPPNLPTFQLPTAINHPIGANFDNLLRLDAAFLPPTATPGHWLPLALTLAPLAPMDTDYKASLRLISPTGQRIAQKDRTLMHNFHQGTSLWPPETVNEYYLLPIPPETPPGDYTVAVVIYHPDTLAPLITNGTAELPLGTVTIGEIRN
jgi:hypothetical protein